jgi:hypothetical protein
MATAITRRAKLYEKPLHPEEALTREQATRGTKSMDASSQTVAGCS